MENVPTRDYYFDNLKFILIYLVVLGHLFEPIWTSSSAIKSIYAFIYFFHMPLFILISGYFSKSDNKVKLLNKIIIPYIVFQVLYYLYTYLVLKQHVECTLFLPIWAMWYLFSLILWKLLAPFFKFKYSIIFAFILGIVFGYDTSAGLYFSLARTICFFPFFLIGYKYDIKSFINKISAKINKFVAAIGLCAILIGIYYFRGHFNTVNINLLYGLNYNAAGYNMWYAGLYRILIYSITAVIALLVLLIIPKHKTFFSKFGQRTMNVFLLHEFIKQSILLTSLYAILGNIKHGYVSIFILALVITFVLSLKAVNYPLEKLCSINYKKIFFRDSEKKVT